MNKKIIGQIKKLGRFSNQNQNKYIELEQKYGCNNYSPIPVVLSRGQGIYVYDVDGKEYIDCLSAYSAVNQGHCHPKIYETFVEQGKKLTLSSRAFYTDQLGETVKYLCELFKYEKVLMMNTGVEAGESAIKIARRWAYCSKKVDPDQATILFAKGNFWGRTIAACASSDDPDRFRNFGPFNGLNFELINYNDIDALENKLKENRNIAAYMLEPIQGENGVKIPDANYLKEVRDVCTKYNVLMICDEIQTGCGRTGELLCVDHYKVRPDIVLLGKSLSGGFYPISAVLCDAFIMDWIKPNEHGSTYGGNPLAAAIVRTALQLLYQENMIINSKNMGFYLLSNLNTISSSAVKQIRGKGLMCAIEFDPQSNLAYKFCLDLKQQGVLAKPTQKNIVRLSPPLIINQQQVDQIFEKIKQTIQQL